MARHTTVNLDTVSKCEELLNAQLKKSSRLDMRKKILNHPILDGGVGHGHLGVVKKDQEIPKFFNQIFKLTIFYNFI